jgi:hypothetical protein
MHNLKFATGILREGLSNCLSSFDLRSATEQIKKRVRKPDLFLRGTKQTGHAQNIF